MIAEEGALGMRAERSDRIIWIRPTSGWSVVDLRQVWKYRELLAFLVWRDLKVRYKQTLLGALWVVLQPLATIAIYSFIFGFLLDVPTEGVPYPLFAYVAMLPWSYFANSLTRASASLVSSAHIVTKIYFPRLILPLSAILAGLVDACVTLLLLLGLMLYYGRWPGIQVLWLPLFFLMAVLTALGFGLWLSALNVRYRDVNYLVPFLVQIWMYATPVIYGTNLIPARYRFLLWLNPMTGVVEGFRWSLLGWHTLEQPILGPLFFVSALIVLVVLGSGLVFFRHMERTFADVI